MGDSAALCPGAIGQAAPRRGALAAMQRVEHASSSEQIPERLKDERGQSARVERGRSTHVERGRSGFAERGGGRVTRVKSRVGSVISGAAWERSLVPSKVAASLASYRERRRLQQAMKKSNNFLSFSAIARDLAQPHKRATPLPPSQPGSRRDLASPAAGKTGGDVEADHGMPGAESGDSAEDEEAEPEIISREVNRKLRRNVFQQSKATNRFRGSLTAQRAEELYAQYVTSYQLPRVKLRLAKVAFFFIAAASPDPIRASRGAAFIVVRVVLPASAMLLAALCCHLERTREYWRVCIVGAATLSYAAVVCADWAQDASTWTPCQKDYNTMWQLIWFLVITQSSSIFFALDLVYVLTALLLQWATFVVMSIALWTRWWEDSGQGNFSWEILWRSPLPDAEELWELHHANATNSTALERLADERVSARILLDCLAISAVTSAVLYAAVRRLNRFERQSFVNAFVLINKASTQLRSESRSTCPAHPRPVRWSPPPPAPTAPTDTALAGQPAARADRREEHRAPGPVLQPHHTALRAAAQAPGPRPRAQTFAQIGPRRSRRRRACRCARRCLRTREDAQPAHHSLLWPLLHGQSRL